MSETNQLWDDDNDTLGSSSGLSLDQELEMALAEPSLDDELDAAFTEHVSETDSSSLDQELDAAFSEPDVASDFDSLDQELDAAFQEETVNVPVESFEEELAESEPEPAFEAEVQEPVVADIPEPVVAAGHDSNDSFNLATLTQLVDEIRQESHRVSEMKASVARALSLIQEMSESLKS